MFTHYKLSPPAQSALRGIYMNDLIFLFRELKKKGAEKRLSTNTKNCILSASCQFVKSNHKNSNKVLDIVAVVRRCSVKKVFLISQNSRKNICPRVSFLIRL